MKGGLGNQLFQYAAARSLAFKLNTSLNIDDSFYINPGSDTPREYLLDNFNIISVSHQTASWQYKLVSLIEKISRKIGFTSRVYFKKYYFNLDNSFSISFFNLPNNSWLTGSFQNEKYFKDSLEVIKRELILKNKPVHNLAVNQPESVFIHIRRGDYVSNLNTANHHGICSLEYYQKAVSLIKESLRNPQFFVFSDDITWVKENLNLAEATYVSGSNLKDYEELYLMSQCSHAITANSTFSWWAAYLIDNPSKIIISPKDWFASEKDNLPDLIPDTWLKI